MSPDAINGIVQASAGAIGGITNLIGAGQQRKAQAQENRNQLVQMVLASRMQNQQAEIQQRQIQQEQTSTNKTTTYLLIGGIGLVIIGLLFFILWHSKQQQK